MAPQLKTERPSDLASELASIGEKRTAEAAAKVAREEYSSWLATMESLRCVIHTSSQLHGVGW